MFFAVLQSFLRMQNWSFRPLNGVRLHIVKVITIQLKRIYFILHWTGKRLNCIAINFTVRQTHLIQRSEWLILNPKEALQTWSQVKHIETKKPEWSPLYIELVITLCKQQLQEYSFWNGILCIVITSKWHLNTVECSCDPLFCAQIANQYHLRAIILQLWSHVLWIVKQQRVNEFNA